MKLDELLVSLVSLGGIVIIVWRWVAFCEHVKRIADALDDLADHFCDSDDGDGGNED